jgi:hypothetical protein
MLDDVWNHGGGCKRKALKMNYLIVDGVVGYIKQNWDKISIIKKSQKRK